MRACGRARVSPLTMSVNEQATNPLRSWEHARQRSCDTHSKISHPPSRAAGRLVHRTFSRRERLRVFKNMTPNWAEGLSKHGSPGLSWLRGSKPPLPPSLKARRGLTSITKPSRTTQMDPAVFIAAPVSIVRYQLAWLVGSPISFAGVLCVCQCVCVCVCVCEILRAPALLRSLAPSLLRSLVHMRVYGRVYVHVYMYVYTYIYRTYTYTYTYTFHRSLAPSRPPRSLAPSHSCSLSVRALSLSSTRALHMTPQTDFS